MKTVERFRNEKEKLREKVRDMHGVVGYGLGRWVENGVICDEWCVKIYVTSVQDCDMRSIPKALKMFGQDSMRTQVIEAGDLSFTGFLGTYRPAQPGAVIGVQGGTYPGTFGAMVTDNTDGQQVILGVNHVMTQFNTKPLGSPIIQPNNGNGGAAPGSTIGTLKRFVTFNTARNSVNYVDAAIATPTPSNIVDPNPLCASVTPTTQGAVGMLYSGSSAITVISPYENIESLMNVTFPKKKIATVGMSIHACCAFSGYKTTTVTSVMTDLLLGGVWFMDQIVCPGGVVNGPSGDSGAVFYTTFNV
jgi:hypothetical protein